MKKLKFLLATPALVGFFALFQIETVAQVKETIEVQETEETSFLVRENFTKDDFAKLSTKLKDDFDIDFSVRNIKYENNKIKSLDYTIRNKDLKISTSERSLDKHIDPFLIIVNLHESKPFKVEKYSEKAKYSYTVDNDKNPTFEITGQEWKNKTWIEKVTTNQKTIFVIDGRESSEKEVRRLTSDEIFIINIHKDEKMIKKYNRKADNIVIIKTKKQIKNLGNLDKDLELLLSDRKAFDRIAAKYPIYVDDELLTKKQLKNFDTKTIRSMYVDENTTEIKLTTRKSESETFFFKIEDDNSQSANNKTHSSIFINGKESTEEELRNHINKINQQKKDSLSSSNKIQVQKLNDKDTHVIIKGISTASTEKTIYIVDGKELNSGDFRKIHPSDIERIDVLKDQKAKEKYGQKGKDDVLLITTKAKKDAAVQTNDGREFFEKLKKAAQKKKEEQEMNKVASLKQKREALKARELAMKQRNEVVAERKEIISQSRKEREKSRQQLLKKRNEISEKTQQRRKDLEEQREKLLAKRKETIIVSNKNSDKKQLEDDYKTLNNIFNDLNKTVKEIEDDNIKITSVKASLTREDGTKVELSEVY